MKVYLETYGCTTNKGDTELMAGVLEKDFEIVDSVDECGIAVVNSCGVIEYTERKVLKRVSELRDAGKKVILCGCLPGINPAAAGASDASLVLGTRDIGRINQAVKSVLAGEGFKGSGENGMVKPDMPKRRKGVIAIVSISEGCLGRCSYCGTKRARGQLKSYPIDSIVSEVQECVNKGFKEIQLTSQDTGVYGMDTGTCLPELLEAVTDIPGDFRVRVGMMNPGHILGIRDELLQAFRSDKVYKFLHLPVQSGDDGVLKDMRRGYSVRDFRGLVRDFREEFPDTTLSTDVLVGYPTEDGASFEKTYSLVKDIRPEVLNITRFSPRPGTPAAQLKDMPDREKKERSRRLTKLHLRMGEERNRGFIGRELSVLITETGKNGTVLARTDGYRQVVLREGELGERLKVLIEGATPTYLVGRAVG
jgi:MiaB-like tRNA modifying enzyme